MSPDGTALAWARKRSEQSDEIVVWNVESNTQRLVFRGHEDRVSSVAFSPDGHMMASATGVSDYFATKLRNRIRDQALGCTVRCRNSDAPSHRGHDR